jgi:hypothetical protein
MRYGFANGGGVEWRRDGDVKLTSCRVSGTPKTV